MVTISVIIDSDKLKGCPYGYFPGDLVHVFIKAVNKKTYWVFDFDKLCMN